jgi:hypothetical protein
MLLDWCAPGVFLPEKKSEAISVVQLLANHLIDLCRDFI